MTEPSPRSEPDAAGGGQRRELDEDRVRGLMLGLALADTYAERETARAGVLHGTCLTQLACFTLEGLIRASVRWTHKGICHPPSVIWHAWCRWAHLQGLGPTFARHWGDGSASWPDGWLCQVRPLSQRRGSAPATVRALRKSPAVPKRPLAEGSAGHHAVTRSLPIAIFRTTDDLVRETVQYTHGSPEAARAAVEAVAMAGELLIGNAAALRPTTTGVRPYPSGTAPHALHHGTVAAAQADTFQEAMSRASSSGEGPTLVAGAMFGAAHGVQSLADTWIDHLEIGWVVDRLARDAFAELTLDASQHNGGNRPDPIWWSRYPGG